MSRAEQLQLLADAPLREGPTIRSAKLSRPAGQARGYAALPGSGPEGETCRSCRHAVPNDCSRRFWKCALVKMTRGPATDIRLKWPACSRWQAPEPRL